MAFFRDRAGAEYFMVVNKDTADATGAALAAPVTLSFHPSVRAIRQLRRDTGRIVTIDVRDHHTLSIPGGTGELFTFGAGAPFAGLDPIRRPRLAGADPSDGGTAGRLARNVLSFTFDGEAADVHAWIRRRDKEHDLVDENVADRLERAVEGRTVVYTDVNGILRSDSDYQADLQWAEAAPIRFRMVPGDADGDGELTKADAARVRAAMGRREQRLREDLDGDGSVGDKDMRLALRTVEPLRFVWNEDFESYRDGELTGQGGWLGPAVLPGSLVTDAMAPRGNVIGTTQMHAIGGVQAAAGPDPSHRNGNEKRILDIGGVGGTGRLILGFTGRTDLGREGFHIISLFMFNSRDADGARGGFISRSTSTASSSCNCRAA